MQQESASVSNSATVVGTIVSDYVFSHDVYGEGFYTCYLEVPRLSNTTDLLPITVSERLIDRSTVPVGSLVQIQGQIRSYNNYVEANGRNRLVLTLFSREIETGEFSAQNPNEIFLNGYICKPPVYRTTPFGREICDLLLAVNRSYNKSDYIPCIAWGRNAKFAGKLNIGDNIRLWGRMQSRGYQKKLENGVVEEKTAYEISISKLESVEHGE